MKSNSNLEITNYSIDPITQQLTSVEVNGENFGGENAKLLDFEGEWKVQDYGAEIKLTNEQIKEMGYDGVSSFDITLTDILPEAVTVDDITVTISSEPVIKTITIRDLDGNILYEPSLKITLQSQAG